MVQIFGTKAASMIIICLPVKYSRSSQKGSFKVTFYFMDMENQGESKLLRSWHDV